jgi:hypothetical protein
METQKDDMAITDQAGATGGEVVTPNDDIAESRPTATPLPEQMTLRQFRALRAKYFTVKHKRMEPCGHRLDAINEPRNNCEFCWFAFFQTHGELVQTVDRAAMEQGLDFIDRMRGRKFRVMFLRFMSTVAMFKQEIEAAKGQDGQAGENQSSERVGQDARQNLQDQGNLSNYGQESGPVASDVPDPIAVV